MAAPASLRILGKEYAVKCPGEAIPGSDAAGLCDYMECTITYASKQSPQQVKDTIIHEALHAIDYAMQTGLTEGQVHALAGGVYALMAENPEFTRWVLSKT